LKKRIVRVSPLQAGKVLALLYGIISIPFVAIMAAVSLIGQNQSGPPLLVMLAFPVIYVVFGFIFTVIGAWLYNVVANWTGGIEFETLERPQA
jgi:uncharacterized membrane protein YvlD (DUF360 family)